MERAILVFFKKAYFNVYVRKQMANIFIDHLMLFIRITAQYPSQFHPSSEPVINKIKTDFERFTLTKKA